MRHQRQQIRLSRLDPRRLAFDNEVLEGQLFAAGRWRRGRAVLPRDVPFWELALEIRDEVLLGGSLACGAGNAGDEERREERAGFVVEEVARRGYGLQEAVRQWLVGVCLGRGEEEICQGRKGGWQREQHLKDALKRLLTRQLSLSLSYIEPGVVAITTKLMDDVLVLGSWQDVVTNAEPLVQRRLD